MKAHELIFRPFEDEKTPPMTCNMCNKVGGKGFLFADIKISDNAEFMLVMCSTTCENNFKNHKLVDQYLKEQISKIKKLHRMQAIKRMGGKK